MVWNYNCRLCTGRSGVPRPPDVTNGMSGASAAGLERALLAAQLVRKKTAAQREASDSQARRAARLREARRLAARAAAEEQDDESDLTRPELCPICLYDLPSAVPSSSERGAALRVLPCAHAFHSDCIQPWLARKRSCPLCRAVCALCAHDDRYDDHSGVERVADHLDVPPRARQIHRCGMPNLVFLLRDGPYCAGCKRWLDPEREDLPANSTALTHVNGHEALPRAGPTAGRRGIAAGRGGEWGQALSRARVSQA